MTKPERFLDLFQPYIESVSPYEHFTERNDKFSCPFICFNSYNPYSFIMTRKKPKNRYPFRSDHYGEYPPPSLPQRLKKQNKGGGTPSLKEVYFVMKFLLQVARRERIKDAVIIKEEVRHCTWAKKSSEVWEGERTRFVCFGLIFAWQSLSPPISRLWAAQPVKKIHPPPATLTTRPRQGAHDLNFELERGERIKKISGSFFPQNYQQGRFFLSAALIVTVVLRLKKQVYSNCVRVPTLRTVLTCDHAALLPFLFWGREEKDAWYIYFTRRSLFPFSRPPTFALSPKKKERDNFLKVAEQLSDRNFVSEGETPRFRWGEVAAFLRLCDGILSGRTILIAGLFIFSRPLFQRDGMPVQYCTAVFQSSQSSKEDDERLDQGLAGYCHPWPKPPHGAFVHCLIRWVTS